MEEIFDIHCHIIPGIDDGAGGWAEALNMLKMEYEDGVRNIICTPHYRRGMFEADRDTVSERFRKLQDESLMKWKDLRLYLGCEFHVNTDMLDFLESDGRYRMSGGRYVLLEFSEVDDYSKVRNSAGILQSSGYIPVIAHAERYSCLRKRVDHIEELKDMGVWIQVNSGSITGEDGWSVKYFCRTLLRRNLIDLVGSDAHNTRKRIPNMGTCAEYLCKKYGTSYARRILIENPVRML